MTAPRLLTSASAVGLTLASASAQTQLWARQFGSEHHDYVRGAAEEDSHGAYIVGAAGGPLFGPTGGTFIARYNGAGDFLWGRQLADVGPTAAAADPAGGVYVSGVTGGSPFAPNAGIDDAVLVRCDGAGALMWGRQFGSDDYDVPFALASDGAGGVFMTGWTEGDLAGPNVGGRDVWIARFTEAGSRTWLRQFGTPLTEWANAIAPDGTGGFFLAGVTDGDLGGPSAGPPDAWVGRFDGAGNQVWIRQFGGALHDEAHGLASDGQGGLYTCGQTDFMGSPSWRPWLQRRDGAGDLIWERLFSADLFGEDLASDGTGGVFVAGYTYWGGPGGTNAWIGRYSAAGERTMFDELATGAQDYASAIVSAGPGSAVVTGYTWASLGGPHQGRFDAWLARYAEACYADCDTSTGPGNLDVFDFLCFGNRYDQRDPYACDCDTSTGQGVCDVFDFLCFQNAYANGCP